MIANNDSMLILKIKMI